MSVNEEIETMRNRCIMCGSCIKVCPSYKHGGCNPMSLVNGTSTDVQYCIGCGNCTTVCKKLDPAKLIQRLIYSIKNKQLPKCAEETGYVMPLMKSECPPPIWSGDDVSLMPGCVVKCKAPFIEYAASVALYEMKMAAKEIPVSACCTHPVVFRSLSDKDCIKQIAKMYNSASNSEIITLCGGCSYEFNNAGFDASHIIHFFYNNIEKLPKTKNKIKVSLEPGCAAMPLLNEMIAIVEHMGFEYVHNEAGCCGKSIDMAPKMMKERISASKNAEIIIVGCPMCFLKYDSLEFGKPVMHISELVSYAFGNTKSMNYHNIKLKSLGTENTA